MTGVGHGLSKFWPAQVKVSIIGPGDAMSDNTKCNKGRYRVTGTRRHDHDSPVHLQVSHNLPNHFIEIDLSITPPFGAVTRTTCTQTSL